MFGDNRTGSEPESTAAANPSLPHVGPRESSVAWRLTFSSRSSVILTKTTGSMLSALPSLITMPKLGSRRPRSSNDG